MKIFKDNKKQLNINPLVVYFIMTPEEKEHHARDIERLNRSKTMNHNLFEFNTVVRARYNNNVLTKGLIKDMEENNVIVKLFGNDDERFSYAFETVEFKEGYFESQVESFLYDVCTLNVKNLKSEKKRLNNYPSKERNGAVEILLKSFTEAVNEFGFKKVHAIASRRSSDVSSTFNPNRSLEKVSCRFLMTAIRKRQETFSNDRFGFIKASLHVTVKYPKR